MNVIIVVGVEISSRDGSLFISLSVILCLDLVMKAPRRNVSATLLDGFESEGRHWWIQLNKIHWTWVIFVLSTAPVNYS